jgi:hypothetical protein
MSGVSRQTLLAHLQTDLIRFDSVDKKSPFVSPQEVAATQLRESIFKKFEDPNPRADAKAISKFLLINDKAGTFKPVVHHSWFDENIGDLKRIVDNFLHPNGHLLAGSFHDMFLHGELGSGASIRGGGGDFYTKMFSSELSTTSLALYSSYRSSIKDLPAWSEAESFRFSKSHGPRLVEGNRLSCVPKNVDISRTICTEPTLNMWYQLGLGNMLRDRLREFFGINLANVADVNRRLAYQGSLDSSEMSMSTIDLESASDSISLGLCDWLFPQWFSQLLRDLRSPLCRMPDGTTLALNMVSTMGNGFTFPLQTFIFSAVVCSVYREMGIPLSRVDAEKPNWSVFGDDIVVCRKAYSRVCQVLSILGFTVNEQKSFSEGPFRESCGYDLFKGHMVRGVYLKRLECPQDTFVAFNKLVRWSALHKIALNGTLQYLLRKAPFNVVPFWEADDAGFKVPDWWPAVRKLKRGDMYRYKAYVPKLGKLRLADTAIGVPRSLRRRLYNPSGLLVSIARGDWTRGTMVTRLSGRRSSVQVRRYAHSWDIPPDTRIISSWIRTQYFNWYGELRSKLSTREAIDPIAGSVEGKQCESAFRELPTW